MLITILTVCIFSVLLLTSLLGIKKIREYFLRYEKKEIAMIFLVFIFILLQSFIFIEDERYLTTAWQKFTQLILYLSIIILIVLFKKYKNDINLLEIILVLGILQVAIAMMISSSNDVDWDLKLWANIIYLTIPSYAVYFLTRPKEENKEEINKKSEPQEKEVS